MHVDVIVIGAGPTGLITARELSRAHKTTLLLEARDRIGGRAYTVYNEEGTLESGAEFVHGKLPITLSLLELAGLSYTETGGKWVQIKGGSSKEERDPAGWSLLLRKLKALKEDTTLQDFLQRHFPGPEHAALKDRAIGFAEGYDSADASRASAMALYKEWSAEDEHQYRVDKGYSPLMDFLAAECRDAGCSILLSHPVTAITSQNGKVEITTANTTFTADKVVLALPLGVLQQDGLLAIKPSAPSHAAAIQQLGFGDVIKFVFSFKEPFWENAYPGLGFLMSGATVPTWWTQAPSKSAVLTGWMAGRAARAHAHMPSGQLYDVAVQSLAQIFSKDKTWIESLIADTHIANWSSDPYTLGSYAYATVGAAAAISTLSEPIEGSIYFAGEYMYEGPAMGTVEAAFWSGIETARKILSWQ